MASLLSHQLSKAACKDVASIVNKVYYHVKKSLESPHLRGGGGGVLLGVSDGSVRPSSPKS